VPGDTLATTRRLALAGMFAGLAWGAGYVDSIPNLEFLTVILFAAGWVLGPGWGALAGALGEFLYSAINPYGSGLMHPLVLASQVAGMALSGVAGGVLARIAPPQPWARAFAVVCAGIAVTLVFDLLTNLASGAVYGQWRATLWAALPFTAIHVGTNAALFATVGVLLVNALERTRRSLLPAAIVCTFALVLPGAAHAQAPVTPVPTPAAPPVAADSLKKPANLPPDAVAGPADSIAYRDLARAQPPPAWGDGPAALLRRDDGSLSGALTHEGGFVERFADERGSAEPLGRFGLAGSNRVLIDWLGLPLSGIGAVGGETPRLPWNAVARMEGPRLPVSATEPFRGELGAVTLEPYASVPRHPRVQAWASLGDPAQTGNGFTASGRLRRWDGFLAVDAGALAPLEPLGPEGHHSLASRVAFDDGLWKFAATYRVSRQALESLEPRWENRKGEGGALELARTLPGEARAALKFERTADALDDESALGATTQSGKGGRATLRYDTAPAEKTAFGAVTYGRESLESGGTAAFDRREANLWWATAGGAMDLGEAWRARGALGAGKYGDGPTEIAPSLLVESRADGTTSWWGGVARGLSAAIDPRLLDSDGVPVPGDPPVARRSTWLLGIGLTKRADWDKSGGSWRGTAPPGALTIRTAAWAGRGTPAFDPTRFLLAGESVERPDYVDPGAIRFVAWTGNARWSPWSGVTLDGGAQALAREVPAAIVPFDSELRALGTVEGRHRFGVAGPDARLAASAEWLGPRDGPGLPAMARFGLAAAVIVDEFEVRARWDNFAGSNRILPLADPFSAGNLAAEEGRLRVEVRWTFWD